MLVPAWDFRVDGFWHGHIAVMRAVEDGFSLVRSARNGLITVADDRGRIVAETASHSALCHAAGECSGRAQPDSVSAAGRLVRVVRDGAGCLGTRAVVGSIAKLKRSPELRRSKHCGCLSTGPVANALRPFAMRASLAGARAICLKPRRESSHFAVCRCKLEK